MNASARALATSCTSEIRVNIVPLLLVQLNIELLVGLLDRLRHDVSRTSTLVVHAALLSHERNGTRAARVRAPRLFLTN